MLQASLVIGSCVLLFFSSYTRLSPSNVSKKTIFRSLASSVNDTSSSGNSSISSGTAALVNLTLPQNITESQSNIVSFLKFGNTSNISYVSNTTNFTAFSATIGVNTTGFMEDVLKNLANTSAIPLGKQVTDVSKGWIASSILNSSSTPSSVRFVEVVKGSDQVPAVPISQLTPAAAVSSVAVSTEMDLAKAKGLAQNLLSLIHSRYELSGSIGSQFWHTTNNMVGANIFSSFSS